MCLCKSNFLFKTLLILDKYRYYSRIKRVLGKNLNLRKHSIDVTRCKLNCEKVKAKSKLHSDSHKVKYYSYGLESKRFFKIFLIRFGVTLHSYLTIFCDYFYLIFILLLIIRIPIHFFTFFRYLFILLFIFSVLPFILFYFVFFYLLFFLFFHFTFFILFFLVYL